MKILGIESAAMTASVALLEDEHLIAEYTADYKKTHSQTLLPMIAEIKKMVDLDLDTLDAIAVSGGPGSFTGLRIGSATAKGLGLALKKPLIHVPTLEALAFRAAFMGGLICPMMDARKGFVFTAIYRGGETMTEVKAPCHASIKELAEAINETGEAVLVIGDGVDAYYEQLKELVSVPLSKAPSFIRHASAASVAALGLIYAKEGKTESATEHAPDYLRVSQAERQLAMAKES